MGVNSHDETRICHCGSAASCRPGCPCRSPPSPGSSLETFACNFAKGKDLDDFLAVAKKWDRFADDGFSEPYEGFVLTPFYFNADNDADVYWVGVSPNFAAQGTTADEWMAKGSALQKAFDQVAPCQSHSQMASIAVRDINRSTGVVDFSACSLKPGATRRSAPLMGKWWNF